MILLKYLLPILVILYSNSAFSQIEGSWCAQSNNNIHSFSIKIEKSDKNKVNMIDYGFVYSSGRKLNDYTYTGYGTPLYFYRQKNGCYKGHVLGFSPGQRVSVTLCKKNNGWTWLRSDHPLVEYVPKKEFFLRCE